MKRVSILLCFLSLPAVAWASVDIAGGSTSVTFNDAFLGLGLGVAPLGTAELDGATATFPITGGSILDDGNALIEHDGSGLALASMATTVTLENFLIDTAAANISGKVTLDGDLVGEGIPLFDLSSDLALSVTPEAAGALEAAFGVPGLAGVEIASATTSPEAVPEPQSATTMLLLLGILGYGFNSWRRQLQ